MKKIISQITILAAAFLFISNSNAKAREDFNLNSITASDIGRSDGHSSLSVRQSSSDGMRHPLVMGLSREHSFEFSDDSGKSGIFNWFKQKKPKPMAAKEWTVMIFMNAKNNLVKAAKKDIAEMKKVGTTKAVNVLVQYGALKKKTKRMMIEKRVEDDNGFLSSGEVVYEKFKNVDMGDYKEVANFIKWSKTNFPAKKYMLVLWNHGTGWIDPKMENENNPVPAGKGILFDDETQNYVKTNQMVEIFKMAGPVDIYVNNACLMQMAEIAYEVKDNIGLLIGSEETMLAQGFDYKRLLNFMNADTSFSDREISDFLMSWYREFYNEGMELGPITVPLDAVGATLSTIRPQALNNLPYHLDRFASAAMRNNDTDAVKYAIEHVIRFTSIDAKDKEKMLSSYVDLYNFTKLVTVKLIVDKPSSHDTIQAAEDLMNFINTELVIRKVGINGDETNGYDYSNVGGIAIEMTRKNKKTLAIDLSSLFTTKYSDLSLSKASLWDEFLTWTDEVWAQ
ncbi:MAG: hypothetical protein KAJ48_02510 [Elusimicrobiales bacterium]|nr:hypothetical protein [Elusimicrobiales bacterium]